MIPPTSRKSNGAISANSTTAVPRSDPSLRVPFRAREWREGSLIDDVAICAGTLSFMTNPVSSLQRRADLAEDVRDLRSEHREDRDRDDGDQREQKGVLDEGLALFAISKLFERAP